MCGPSENGPRRRDGVGVAADEATPSKEQRKPSNLASVGSLGTKSNSAVVSRVGLGGPDEELGRLGGGEVERPAERAVGVAVVAGGVHAADGEGVQARGGAVTEVVG